jgi:hypothetical protein
MDWGWSVQQTFDGGFIIAGVTWSFGAGSADVYHIKTDSLGDTLWTKTYGGANSDYGHSVQQTLDGGYIIAGRTQSYGAGVSDVYLIRTDSLGDTLWTKTYGGVYQDEGFSVQQTSDGGYIIVGDTDTYGTGAFFAYLIKTDSLGDTLWTGRYGETLSDCIGWSVQQTADDGYIIAGYAEVVGHYDDVYLFKIDSLGDTLWTKTYGGVYYDYGYAVQQTADGGYIVAGRTNSYGAGGYDVYLIKTDSLGDTLWTRAIGGGIWDIGRSVQQTTDGGYIVVGYTDSFGGLFNYDVYVIKTDANGDTLWTQIYGGVSPDQGYSVKQTSDNGYIIAGFTSSFGAGSYDVYLIRIGREPGVEENQTARISNRQISATLFHGPLKLPEGKNCKVFDIAGRVVTPDEIQPGIYFIEADGAVTQKVVKVR